MQRSQAAKAKPVTTKEATKRRATFSFSHLQPVADGEADYLTTDTAPAILAAAAKARTPTNRKPPASSSKAGQVIAAGKKRRGEI